MAVIDSAYQYYLSTYAGSGMSRYDTHKKSQLRAVYNNIVKVNKDSPLYKINFTRDTGRFAIDIKEQARSIENFIAALSNNAPDDNAEHAFSRKIAQSSDEDAVSVQYIGSNMDADNSTICTPPSPPCTSAATPTTALPGSTRTTPSSSI